MKKTILYTLFFFLIVSTPAIFIQKGLNPEAIRAFVASFGLLAPVFYILITSITNVIPPLAVTPFWIVSILLFGPIGGLFLSFLADILGSTLNFFIARTWGRQAVSRLAGKTALKRIEQLPHVTSSKRIFILKILGGAATDYLSYAAGLSKIGYVPYFVASALAALPMMTLGFYIISGISLDSPMSTIKALGIFYLVNYTLSLSLIPLSIYWMKPKMINQLIEV